MNLVATQMPAKHSRSVFATEDRTPKGSASGWKSSPPNKALSISANKQSFLIESGQVSAPRRESQTRYVSPPPPLLPFRSSSTHADRSTLQRETQSLMLGNCSRQAPANTFAFTHPAAGDLYYQGDIPCAVHGCSCCCTDGVLQWGDNPGGQWIQ